MGPKKSDDFIAEEQKGWVPMVEVVLYKGSRTSSCIQNAWEKAGRHFRSKENQMDFSWVMSSEGCRAVEV